MTVITCRQLKSISIKFNRDEIELIINYERILLQSETRVKLQLSKMSLNGNVPTYTHTHTQRKRERK